MLIIKRQKKEKDEDLIGRFSRKVRNEGLLAEMIEKRFFTGKREKEVLKRKKREAMYGFSMNKKR